MSDRRREIIEWVNRELRKGPTDLEAWEAFYLLSLPPIVEDRHEYNRIRRRLLDEGETCCWER